MRSGLILASNSMRLALHEARALEEPLLAQAQKPLPQ
jgi:hypothetical protein